MVMVKKMLALALLGIGLWANPSLAHEAHAVNETRDVMSTAAQQFSSAGEATAHESLVHGPAVHDHEASLVDTCPQLAAKAESDGLRECVGVLTHQMSDLLRLIMNLSEALAESQNQLMRRNHESQSRPIIQSASPRSYIGNEMQ
ncbi:MAG: hypothetical protein AB1555_15580 [Nitrospirota bacterium]